MKPSYIGKVRDVYDLGQHLIIQSTDRISAFDVVFSEQISGKGKILNKVSLAWFNYFQEYKNHILESDFTKFPEPFNSRMDFSESAILVKKCKRIDFECIVRGYLFGSAYKEYKKTGKVCEYTLEPNLQNAEKLEEPLFTPSTKSDSHDINVSEKFMKSQVGEEIFQKVKATSLDIYKKAHELLKNIGILLCDTKIEFGIYEGEIILIDELLTPDSSRYWDAKTYKPGLVPDSYDKQILRNYLENTGWDKNPPPPPLPNEIVAEIQEKYKLLQEKLIKCLLEK